MSWARIDDSFPEHQKIAELSDRAFRTLVTAICYSARNLTDGHLPPSAIPAVTRGRKATLTELVDANLVHANGNGGFVVHDYLHYNPDAETVKKKRAEAAERMRKIRAGQS